MSAENFRLFNGLAQLEEYSGPGTKSSTTRTSPAARRLTPFLVMSRNCRPALLVRLPLVETDFCGWKNFLNLLGVMVGRPLGFCVL